jgi:non-ribosomal peptide synthetase component F
LHRLDFLDAKDRHQLPAKFNATAREVPPVTLPGMFEQQVALTPDNVAVVFAGTSLTYAELNAQAIQAP